MKILVKNMVCRHCVEALRRALEDVGIEAAETGIGYAVIDREYLPDDLLARLDSRLAAAGFERILSRSEKIADDIKAAVRSHLRDESSCRLNLSACLSDKLNMSYDTLSRHFTKAEGRTIEKYYIAQRVEFIKELTGYGQMSLSEIADRAGYSSVAHLSRQFKEVTGMTPTEYIASRQISRKGINEI